MDQGISSIAATMVASVTWPPTLHSRSSRTQTAPIAEGVPTCLAELVFGVTHEGAVDTADLLERRTRVSLVPADLPRALPSARRALRLLETPQTLVR